MLFHTARSGLLKVKAIKSDQGNKNKKGGREDSKRDCKEKQNRTLYS
jgi:hypothetical protein